MYGVETYFEAEGEKRFSTPYAHALELLFPIELNDPRARMRIVTTSRDAATGIDLYTLRPEFKFGPLEGELPLTKVPDRRTAEDAHNNRIRSAIAKALEDADRHDPPRQVWQMTVGLEIIPNPANEKKFRQLGPGAMQTLLATACGGPDMGIVAAIIPRHPNSRLDLEGRQSCTLLITDIAVSGEETVFHTILENRLNENRALCDKGMIQALRVKRAPVTSNTEIEKQKIIFN